MGASRFYLRSLTPTVAVSAGEKSAVLPVGTYGGGFHPDGSLRTTKGASQVLRTVTYQAVAHEDDYLSRFVSDPLAAQTIGAATWTLGLASSEDNAGGNCFTALSLYVYRPSTDAVIGYIYDSDTALGAEWAVLAQSGQIVFFAGGAVTAALNDLLVLEVWRHGLSAILNFGYIYLDGTTDVFAGQASDAASFIEYPGGISLAGGGGATIVGTVATAFPAFAISASGSTIGGRVASVATAFPAFAISATASVAEGVVVPGRAFNKGYAYTISELEASVVANSDFNTCPLDHASDPDPAHKEPVIDPIPGDAAVTGGGLRSILHLQHPDHVWHTTSVMPSKP